MSSSLNLSPERAETSPEKTDFCQTCEELWRSYTTATRVHVRMLKKQESEGAASIKEFRMLEPQVEVAKHARAYAKAKWMVHHTKSHRNTPPKKSIREI